MIFFKTILQVLKKNHLVLHPEPKKDLVFPKHPYTDRNSYIF